MKHAEKVAPVAAVFSALLSIFCCLPFGIPAAIGLAGLSTVLTSIQPWLLGLSAAFLLIGSGQLYRNRACRRPTRGGLVLLLLAAGIVLGLTFFPQTVAAILADVSSDSIQITDLHPRTLPDLKDEFNRHSGTARVILLLSPT